MRTLFFLLFFSSATVSVFAQVDGRFTGSVVDAEGKAIAGASVALALPDSKIPVLATITTSDGLFSVPGIPPAYYDLTVTAAGFQTYTVRAIKVDPARETTLPAMVLSVQPLTITVEVTAPALTTQTANAAVASTITTEQVRRLPVLDRLVVPLAQTQAGVQDLLVVNGQRASSVEVTLDGIGIRDNYVRNNGLFTPNLLVLDQVAEMTVTTVMANASLSGASHIDLVTPSGTNAFHGTAYFYNRNNALGANTWFNNKAGIKRPSFNQNQIGVAAGGPIRRDKLRFYTNYEAYRYGVDVTTTGTILTQDARNGIFTYQDLSGQVRKVNVLQAAGVTADPAMQQILARVPGPEKINSFAVGDSRESLLRNTAGYSFLRKGHHDRDNVTAKLDHTPSTRNLFTGTLVWNRQDVSRSDLSNDFSSVPKVGQDDKRTLLSLGWRWNPHPNFTNDLRGGFNRAPITFDTSETFGDRIITGTIFSNPVNLFRAQGRNTNTFELKNNSAWSRSSHALQWGFQAEQIRVRSQDDAGTTPSYNLGISLANPGLSDVQLPGIRTTDLPSANALLATLAGYVNQSSQTFNIRDRASGFVSGAPRVRNLRLNNYAFYAQDAWKLLRRLTLNMGLRYELPSVVNEKDSLYLLPKLQNNDATTTLLSNSVLDFAGSSVGRPYYNRDKNNVAPNVGLAWDVFGDGKTSARAGYSLNYINDDTIAAVENYINFNEGVSATVSQAMNGRVSAGLPSIAVPVLKVPRTFQDNFTQNLFTAFGMPDPNLRTPYIQQWSAGIQREIGASILEVRYVGNHSTKLFRGFDVNPEVIRANGFLEDFNRALNNGNLARAATGVFDPAFNPNIAGSKQLTVFPTLVGGGLLTNPLVRGFLQTGEAGELGFEYRLNGLAGPVAFYKSPISLASLLLANTSNANYNALQVDLLRRFRNRLQYQANYTYSKVLSDTDGTASHRFEEFRDPENGKIDRSRPSFDVTHVIKGNAAYDLPFGGGQRFSRLLSGWTVSGITTYKSGNPFSILSGRGTLLREFRSAQNTAGSLVPKQQLDQLLQFRMTSDGPYIVAPSAIGSDGRAVSADGTPAFAGQAFFNPSPGEIGGLQRRSFSGPRNFDFDLALLKKTVLRERQTLEFRVEALNALNHPAWFVPDQNINAVGFGRIQSTANSPRRLQLSLRYEF